MHETTLGSRQSSYLSVAQRVCIFLAGLISIAYGGRMLLLPRAVSVSAYAFSECVEIPSGAPVSSQPWGSQGTYFVNRASSAIRARLQLPSNVTRGQDLWLVHGAADNHCQVRLCSGQTMIAELDNARPEINKHPIWFLSHLGHVPADVDQLEFEFRRRDGAIYFAEMGGLIVAPPGADRAAVVQGLSRTRRHILLLAPFVFLGLLSVTAATAPGFCATRLPYVIVGIAGIVIVMTGLPSKMTSQRKNFSGYPLLNLLAEVKSMDVGSSPITAWLHNRVSQMSLPAFPYDTFDNSLLTNQPQEGVIHGSIDVEAFSRPRLESANEPSKTLLGGLLNRVQLRNYDRLFRHLECLGLAAVIVGGLATWTGRRGWVIATLALLFITSIYISLRVSQGWDELYINLRHSQMLATHGVFSVNKHAMLEGTVDSLPFFLIGLLGKTGLRLDDLALSLGLSGNVLIICVVFDMVRTATRSIGYALITAAAAAVLPCVIYVGGSGFMATLFTGILLLGLDIIYVRGHERNLYAFIPLALLPLIRTEGIVFCLLVFCQQYLPPLFGAFWRGALRRRAIVDTVVGGAVLASGFLAVSLFRCVAFGDWLPIPIVCKATANDPGYLKNGALQLLDICQGFRLEYLWMVLGLALLLFRADVNPNKCLRRNAISVLLMAVIFTLPYFLGGGDWFPLHWARYAMPLVLITMVLTFMVTQRVMVDWMGRWWPLGSGFGFALLICVGGEKSDPNCYLGLQNDLIPTINRWDRIDRFAMFGKFLKTYTTPDACIASPEVATIMYFAEREMLDLLGVSNPDIARSPLYPLSPGNILHRKRNPDTIRKHMPEIIALYEMVHAVGAESIEKPGGVFQVVGDSAFNQPMVDVAYYRAGDFEVLRKLGYRHLAVTVPGYMFNFFVSQTEFESLRDRLVAADYRYVGQGAVPYRLSERMVRHYSPR